MAKKREFTFTINGKPKEELDDEDMRKIRAKFTNLLMPSLHRTTEKYGFSDDAVIGWLKANC